MNGEVQELNNRLNQIQRKIAALGPVVSAEIERRFRIGTETLERLNSSRERSFEQINNKSGSILTDGLRNIIFLAMIIIPLADLIYGHYIYGKISLSNLSIGWLVTVFVLLSVDVIVKSRVSVVYTLLLNFMSDMARAEISRISSIDYSHYQDYVNSINQRHGERVVLSNEIKLWEKLLAEGERSVSAQEYN